MDIWRSSMDELHGRLVWTTFTDLSVVFVHVLSLLGWFFVQTALLALDDSLDEQELGLFFCSPLNNNININISFMLRG